MKVLLIYATYSGSTYVAAEEVGNAITAAGNELALKNANEVNPDEVGQYDLVIMGSPSWDVQGQEGMPHDDVIKLMDTLKGRTYDNKKFAVFGLGNQTYDHFCGAVDHIEQFIKDAHGILAAESLRVDNYYTDQEMKNNQIKEWTAKVLQSSQPAQQV